MVNAKTPIKRKVEKRVQQCISRNVCMEKSGCEVTMTINAKKIELKTSDSNEVVARHEISRISFASGGDEVL